MKIPNRSTSGQGLREFTAESLLLPRAKVAAGLALLTFFIFLPVASYEFINYDDDAFVTNNPKVAPGFTWEGIKWALTSADIDYWRPLSWLSHMLDIELFGAMAGGHHLVNLLIHCAAVVMAFLSLDRLTRAFWPSAMVAALFAWHPLHVESVAWIGERKDVLCGLCWFCTLWAYARYVEQPGSRRYLMTFCWFVLGVMSKPMIVTLPCVLLLLDFWPLRRFALPGTAGGPGGGGPDGTVPLWHLLKEKVPFLAVVLVLSVSTIYSQHHVGAIVELQAYSGAFRLQNSLASYGTYVTQTFLPIGFCVFYPIEKLATLHWVSSGLLILVVGGAGLYWARRFPFVLVGWLWFLGVLFPVIGILQVGDQAHADRYTYLPLTGLFILVVWLAWHWADDQKQRKQFLLWSGVSLLLVCAAVTRSQLSHWENSVTVFRRAVMVTSMNHIAMNNLGAELAAREQTREAIGYLREALRIENRQLPWFNLATAYWQLKDESSALFAMSRGFRMNPKGSYANEQMVSLLDSVSKRPELTMLRKFVAVGHAARGEYVGAAEQLAEVTKLAPADINVRVDQAAFLAMAGQELRAVAVLEEVLKLAPTNALAHSNLGALLAKQGRVQEALAHHQAAIQAQPKNVDSRHNLALLLARIGRIKEAQKEFEEVLRQHPLHQPALQQLAWLLATQAECRDGRTSMRLAGQMMNLARIHTATHLDVLAAAAAAAGEFDQAVEIARKALELARRDRQTALVEAIPVRLALYQSRQPFTQPHVSTN